MNREVQICVCVSREGKVGVGGVGDTSQISLFPIALATVVSLGL